MEHFIQEWKFFNSEMDGARSGLGTLCGLSPLFCDMVIKKAVAILAGPTPEAVKETKLEQLCGRTPTGKNHIRIRVSNTNAYAKILPMESGGAENVRTCKRF